MRACYKYVRVVSAILMYMLFVILVPMGCRETDGRKAVCIMPHDVRLCEGDVVLRCGRELTSHAVMMADGNGAYSHIGIVVDSAGTMVVVHAVPDEPDFKGDVDRVKMDSIGRFFSSAYASDGEVLRYKDAATAACAARHAVEIYRRGTLFDHDYDEDDTTKMCCTELVTFSFAKAGRPLKGMTRHRMEVLGIMTNCAFPSDFMESEDFRSVVKF